MHACPHRSEEGVGLPELESQMVVSLHVVPGAKPLSSGRGASFLNH